MVALCLLITFGSCSDDDAPAEITPNPDSEIYFTGSLDLSLIHILVAQIEKEVGSVDILVNNAGIIRRVPMNEMEACLLYTSPLLDMLRQAVDENFMRTKHGAIWHVAQTPPEAVELIYTTPLWDASIRDVYKRQD